MGSLGEPDQRPSVGGVEVLGGCSVVPPPVSADVAAEHGLLLSQMSDTSMFDDDDLDEGGV